VENRTEPKTARQRLRYIIVAIIALGLVAWMLPAPNNLLCPMVDFNNPNARCANRNDIDFIGLKLVGNRRGCRFVLFKF
jgi:hypothetical protein